MRTLPDEDYVISKLEPFFPLFVNAVLTTWATYMDCIQKYPPFVFPRTRANVIWDWLASNIKDQISDIPEITPIEQPQTNWYQVDDVLFRIKKSDPDGFSRNFPTQGIIDWFDPNMRLEGIPDYRVELVYILNRAGTNIDDIRIVHRNDSRVVWQRSILTDAVVEQFIQQTVMPPKEDGKKKAPVDLKDVVSDDEAVEDE